MPQPFPAPGGDVAAPARSLWPREHGAYAQLLVPLATALALGQPTPAAVAFVLAFGAAFVAHEPLLVALGLRGPRALLRDGLRARRWLTILGSLALVVGALGAALAPPVARMGLSVPLVFAVALAVLITSHAERTASGEALAALALSTASFPVALAAGVDVRSAAIAAGVHAFVFLVATFAVRSIIARTRRTGSPYAGRIAALLALAGLAVAAAAWARGLLPPAAAVALAPVAVFSLALVFLPPHPRHLRRVGWGLAAASLLTMAALVAGLR